MSIGRLVIALCANALVCAPAWAEEAFITQLRLPARGQSVDVFAWRDARGLSVERESLSRLGIAAPPRARVRLDDVPGLAYVEVEREGAVEITCSSDCFPTQRLGARSAAAPDVQTPWGGYLNYDLAAEQNEGQNAMLGAVLEANVFGPLGRGEAGWIARSQAGFTRLDTRWTFDMPQERLRLQIGDAAAPTFDGGLVRFGGVHFGRSFALTPRDVIHPTPRLSGEAESASAVELYIDGVLSARERAQAGPFEIDEPPLISGAGEAQIIVTDVLGRQQVVTRPFYVSTALLRPGLSDWSIAAGALRLAYGRRDFDYGARFAAGRYRIGLTDFLTAQAGVEQRADGATGHIGAALAHYLLGQVSVAYALSADGDAFAFSWLREARAWAFGVQGETRSAGFDALGAPEGAAANAAASFQIRLGAFGDLAATAALAARDGAPDVRAFSIAYIPDLRDVTLNVRLAYTEHTRSEVVLGIGLSVPLDSDVSAAFAGQWDRRGGEYRVSANSAAHAEGGFGWRVRASGGAHERLDAALTYRGAAADAQVRGGWSDSGAALRLELTGAIGWIDEYAFASRAIHGAFALVDAGAPGVSVSRDRLPLGVSGEDGRFLATGLRAFDANVIAIDAEDLPLDRAPRNIAHTIVPADGAGLVVRFLDVAQRIVEAHVQFADGAPVPRGAILVRARDGARFPVGSEGRIVLQGAESGDVLRLESDTRCAAEGGGPALRLSCASAA